MRIRLSCLLLLLALPLLSSAEEGGGEESGWHRLVGILQYLQADYPAAVQSQSEFELAEQRSFIASSEGLQLGA
jgi:high-affinity iron transporter